MQVESFEKTEWEEFVIAGSYEDQQDVNEIIELALSDIKAWHWDDRAVEKTAEILDIATKSKDDAKGYLKVRVKGGDAAEIPTDGKNPGTYLITFYITTNHANQFEVDVKMKVK